MAKKQFEPKAAMWTQRFPSNSPDRVSEGYYFRLKLADNTIIHLRRNKAKMIGDTRPDFIQFDPKDINAKG